MNVFFRSLKCFAWLVACLAAIHVGLTLFPAWSVYCPMMYLVQYPMLNTIVLWIFLLSGIFCLYDFIKLHVTKHCCTCNDCHCKNCH
ncbi:MAG: hypothetical protein UR26_C0005G0015 [candidate division TM6 bacterium GW2011_GWF2_32_72]|nr:MAG: hypothetical protein UR26_C0005G0015 [candidate division TM6 bacterium GW2011_GWF2_32_72]